MKFELTKALVDEILFFMEDQEGCFVLDTVEGIVTGEADISDDAPDDEKRYIELPEWDSANGFRLMERFVSGLRNPVIREELNSALSRGKGVFRAFKDTLSRHPEAEKLWYLHKEKEMEREIYIWYNAMREEWGLEKIGMEPEETGDLVLEDFRFRPFQEEDLVKLEELHKQCVEEYRSKLVEFNFSAQGTSLHNTNTLLKETFTHRELSGDSLTKKNIIAESGGGDLAGYISGTVQDDALYVQILEIKAEYRGLGIGETLLGKLLESSKADKTVSQVFFDLPLWAEGFSRVLLRESFKQYSTRYWLNLR